LTVFKEFYSVISRILFVSIMVGSVVFFAQYKFFSRFIFFASFIFLCIFLSGWRIIKRLILRKLIAGGFHNINILIIGINKISEIVVEEIKKQPQYGFNVVGGLDERENNTEADIPVLGRLEDFYNTVKKYFVDELILTVSPTHPSVAMLIEQAQKMKLGIRFVPENLEQPLPVIDLSYLGIIPLLAYKTREKHPSESVAKKILDFGVAVFLIVLLFIPAIIIAILIKIDSPGPVFYVQKRMGLKGRLFNFYKFRSMFEGAEVLKYELLEKNESKDNVMFKIKDDPRITRVGKFLRKHSLDELPQLFNVLKGDMSLVGPRPPLPCEVEIYAPFDMDRLSIRPGITGLSQIRGRSDLSFSRWIKWDLWYINNWSFWLDIKVLLLTIPAVLKSKGAY
jgi:exopolysaccharide biosynthesis polyprenyl glycosylphosphotransferase